ncbi:MAG: DNA-directed RNA polymerase subunit beta, partial [Fibrobacter sp.]|nr:DNA-directed RNA polymerase subunit beta [Fibrobacter sp.]
EDENNEMTDGHGFISLEDASLIRIYQVMRQNQEGPPNVSTARSYIESMFLTDVRRYDLGEVGRYRLNAKIYSPSGIEERLIKPERDEEEWEIPPSLDTMTMTKADFLAIFLYMVGLYNDENEYHLDDIDHLGNRRVRSIGELLATQLSTGLSRMSRVARDNLLSVEDEKTGPQDLVNVRTVSSVVATFFGSSQLSQFMDQTNPLAELTHKRRMSALGPGGLTRERAGFEVRDVHHTHYGRLCPIETPEGPNIGLINSLATYTVINNFGFIETPYRIVGLIEYKDQKGKKHWFPEHHWFHDIHKAFVRDISLHRKVDLSQSEYDWTLNQLDKTQSVLFESFGNKIFKVPQNDDFVFIKNGQVIESGDVKADYELVGKTIETRVSDFVIYITADEEDKYSVAPASTEIGEDGFFVESFVIVRQESEFPAISNPKKVPIVDAATTERVHLIDVAPMQIVSVAAGLIPFLEHDDANRALMGSNMQRQAVPLLRADSPIVGTGLERRAALDSGTVIRAEKSGVVKFADSNKIVVEHEVEEDEFAIVQDDGEINYKLRKFERSNQDTCINQKPIVEVGQEVKAGDVLADGASTDQGELALGKNALIGFLPWNGYNYEDAIIISEELAVNDVFTSIHIEEFEVEVRETKRGSEELTREVPNVSEEALVNLDEHGIVREGAEVKAGDILVGKITPKGESVQSPEERLLLAIFGEKAEDSRDTSLKVPPGITGVVVETRRFSKKGKDDKSKKKEKKEIEQIKSKYQIEIKKLQDFRDEKLKSLLLGKTSGQIKNKETGQVMSLEGQKFTAKSLRGIDFTEADLDSTFCSDEKLNENVTNFIAKANALINEKAEEMTVELDKIIRGDELKPGVIEMVKVYVAKKRRLSVGDKMAGRHGNKGVVSKIVPIEDMPYTEDGRPLQILLNPLGVPSRMNVGQVLEVHLSYAAKALGFKVATPVFDGASFDQIKEELDKAGLGTDPETGEFTGKTKLYDGKTGEAFLNPVTIGYMYMLKLGHLVDDKIHARSIGPYSLVTQQPLGGKSQFGGQRFGEMEVWALEAYGAAYTLQELLTVKSDDVVGRSNVYDAIVKGNNTPEPGIPESFRVLIREIRALGLNIKSANEE